MSLQDWKACALGTTEAAHCDSTWWLDKSDYALMQGFVMGFLTWEQIHPILDG